MEAPVSLVWTLMCPACVVLSVIPLAGCTKTEDAARSVVEQASQVVPEVQTPRGVLKKLQAPRSRPMATASGNRAVRAVGAPAKLGDRPLEQPVTGGDRLLALESSDDGTEAFHVLAAVGAGRRVPKPTPKGKLTRVLALANDHAYYLQMDSGLANKRPGPHELWRVPIGGGAAERLDAAAGEIKPQSLAFSKGWRFQPKGGGPYVAAEPSRILAGPIGKPATTTVRGPEPNTVAALLVLDGVLYWTSQGRPVRALDHRPGTLWRKPLGPEGAPGAGPAENLVTAVNRPDALAASGGDLYYLTSGTPRHGMRDAQLVRWSPRTGQSSVVVEWLGQGNRLTALGDRLCWLGGTFATWEVACFAPKTDQLTLIHTADSAKVSIWSLAAFDGKVVWGQSVSGTSELMMAEVP